MEGQTTYTVEEAAAVLGESPARVREMLAAGELEGIPPGATLSGEWKVLLSASASDDPGQERPAEQDVESAPWDQREPPGAPEGVEQFVEPPQSATGTDGERAAAEGLSRGDNAVVEGGTTAPSGWVSTQQAARALGISPRTVRWHIEQGNLQAKPQGEGVKRSWLVSIDSLQALRDARRSAGDTRRDYRAPPEGADIAAGGLGNPIRELADRLAEEAARAAEYRVRLELTERAASSVQAELTEERRRREEAERERDELRRELEARKERPGVPETAVEGPGSAEPRPAVAGAQRGARRLSLRRALRMLRR